MGDTVHDYWDFVDVDGLVTATYTIQIPANSLLKEVYAQVLTASNAGTTDSLKAGDGSDDDGVLVAADIKAVAGTFYGDVLTEKGVYMKDEYTAATTPAVDEFSVGGGKFYAAADTLDIVDTVTGTKTAGKTRVFAHIITFDMS
jgi:hypothetical protein